MSKNLAYVCVKCGSKHVEFELTIKRYFENKTHLFSERNAIENQKVYLANCESCGHSEDLSIDAKNFNPFAK